MIAHSEQDWVESVKGLPAERYAEVRTLSWRVPILLSYPNGKGGQPYAVKFDFAHFHLI